MIYQPLFDKVKDPAIVYAGLVGAGDFGTAIVTQSRYIPRLKFPVVADINLEAARRAFKLSGFSDEDIVVCEDKESLLLCMERGKPAITTHAELLPMLPLLHVITTATRISEVGASIAYQAITHGKHVVMVDKEADSAVGPILSKLAKDAGVIYTTDDGDEPGLLMGMVSWAKTLGMEIICAGNIDHCLYQPEKNRVVKGSEGSGIIIDIAPEDRWALEPIPPGQARKYIEARDRIFAGFLPIKETGDPIIHMSLVTNATGLLPDKNGVHRPIARITELPEILCSVKDGGILESLGVIEQPIILRTEDQPHGGGGIFIIVTHADEYSRNIMASKGLHHNALKNAMLIYRPYHLCGAETAMSILCAGLLQVPTGVGDLYPHVDLHTEARRDFKAGEIIGAGMNTLAFGFCTDFRTVMKPAQPLGCDSPVPYFMLLGNRLTMDVPAGTIITGKMVSRPDQSTLWMLRDKQDAYFFGNS